MLSGIGPADHLNSLGIRPLHDLPGVGGNLQDHLDAAILQHAKPGTTYGRSNKLWALYQYMVNKKGPGTSPIAESGGFLYTRQGLSAPDIQLHFLPVMVVDHGRTEMRKDGYSLHVCTLRPESRGTIRLKSKDPKEHPLIDANYLAERRDLDTLIDGVKMGRDIFAQAGLDPYRADEFQPGAAVKTDAELEQWIRAKCETIYHPVGTCKMGPSTDPMAVVDNRCRVHGLVGLRVVDASVMPTLVGGNTNAPTIMIAERVAGFMQEP
jgi:choline dehydrogenase